MVRQLLGIRPCNSSALRVRVFDTGNCRSFITRKLSDEGVHLLIADIEAAELIEGQLIGSSQTQDLPVQQQIQPMQFGMQVCSGIGEHPTYPS